MELGEHFLGYTIVQVAHTLGGEYPSLIRWNDLRDEDGKLTKSLLERFTNGEGKFSMVPNNAIVVGVEGEDMISVDSLNTDARGPFFPAQWKMMENGKPYRAFLINGLHRKLATRALCKSAIDAWEAAHAAPNDPNSSTVKAQSAAIIRSQGTFLAAVYDVKGMKVDAQQYTMCMTYLTSNNFASRPDSMHFQLVDAVKRYGAAKLDGTDIDAVVSMLRGSNGQDLNKLFAPQHLEAAQDLYQIFRYPHFANGLSWNVNTIMEMRKTIWAVS